MQEIDYEILEELIIKQGILACLVDDKSNTKVFLGEDR